MKRVAQLNINSTRAVMMFLIQFEGCIPADEMKFVLQHLPGQINFKVQNCEAMLLFLPTFNILKGD